MSWAKLDDRANEHRKQLAAGPEACWLWACGLMYANRQDARDGFIPDAMVGLLFPFKKPYATARKLVDVGLWDRVDGGYKIHQFEDWNKSREQLDADRLSARKRVAKHRRNGVSNGVTGGSCNGVTPETPPPQRNGVGTGSGSGVGSGSGSPEGGSGGQGQAESIDDGVSETICPADLLQRLESAGAVKSLSDKLSAPIESVRQELQQFVGYWTIGKGAGQRRSAWAGKARQWVLDQHKKPGGLKPAPEPKRDPAELRRKREAAEAQATEARRRDVSAAVAGAAPDVGKARAALAQLEAGE